MHIPVPKTFKALLFRINLRGVPFLCKQQEKRRKAFHPCLNGNQMTRMLMILASAHKSTRRERMDADYQEGEEEDYLKELEDDGNLEEDGEGLENSSDG